MSVHDEFPTETPAVVTCGLPYANGDLHVGHLRTYVSGDAYSRALERVGQDVAFVCGSDMHGTPIAVNAAERGVDPEEFALGYHEQYQETFPEFNVEFDNYGHTHDETNTELTREFVRSWIDGDHVFEKEIEVAWDSETDQPLPDRFVEGTCPYCGEHARGDECDEGCQRHLEPGEIEDPVSTITGNPAEYRTRPHKFLRLADFQEYLKGFIDRLEGTENAKNQPREWIEGELQDLCITRDMEWGIDYPEEYETSETSRGGGDSGERSRSGDGNAVSRDDEDGRGPSSNHSPGRASGRSPQAEAAGDELVLYVWVDAPIEYVASTKQYAERVGTDRYDWEAVWKNHGTDEHPDGGEIVHIIGHDIIQHHTVFWPAMLRGADYNEPRAVMACGFVNLAGEAFSTSRNRAVWADDYLDSGLHPDLYRYHIVTGSEFVADVNFSWDGLQERVNSELVGTLGNFCYRSLLFAERNYGGTPQADVSEAVRDRIEESMAAFREAINDYRVRGLGRAPVELAKFGNEYIQKNEPWKLTDEESEARSASEEPSSAEGSRSRDGDAVSRDDEDGQRPSSNHSAESRAAEPRDDGDEPRGPERAAQVIRDCVQVAKAAAVLMEPVLPGKAEELWNQLGEDGSVHDADLGDALAAPPAEFGEPAELFDQIEDDRVEALERQLEERVEAGEDKDGADGADEAASSDEAADLEPVREERVGFEQFQELDLRVGEVLAADPVEGADKLARLEVDIGVETRQVVAGIKQLHDLEELPGTRVVVVANLEKSELFGIESDGMLLAAGEEADLLTTHGDAEPGTTVK